MTEVTAFLWTERLIALAVLLQTVELLQIRRVYSDQGVWTWEVLAQDFSNSPLIVQKLFGALFNYRSFLVLLSTRFVCAAMIWYSSHPALWLILALTSLLTSVRWRGAFNGGSDAMTFQILASLFAASAFPDSPKVKLGCLLYISIQACLSHFISGVAKLKHSRWRSGQALVSILDLPYSYASSGSKDRMRGARMPLVLSWLALTFQLLFPVALLNQQISLLFIGAAIVFHLANFMVLGLNRFFFAWLAAYPALYYCSQLAF